MACPSTQVYHQHGAYMREVWAWFGIGTLVIILRMFVRLRTVGWRQLKGDDYIAPLVWIFFLCDCVTVTLVYYWGSNLDYVDLDLQNLQDCQVDRIRMGSRMQLLAWYTYTALLWGLKTMVLFFLNRLTFGLVQQSLVKLFGVISFFSYLAVFITISCGCFPIERNWQVRPLPPLKCTMKLQNFYVTTAFNVATDLMIMSIPIPLLWGMRISIGKKVMVTSMLCSGIFMIIAAGLRIGFSLFGRNALIINAWGTRETVVGIIAVNVPFLRQVFQKNFWRFSFDSNRGTTPPPQPAPPGVNPEGTIGSSERWRRRGRGIEMFSELQSTTDGSKGKTTTSTTTNVLDEESEGISASRGGGRGMVVDHGSQSSEEMARDLERSWDLEAGGLSVRAETGVFNELIIRQAEERIRPVEISKRHSIYQGAKAQLSFSRLLQQLGLRTSTGIHGDSVL